MHFETEKKIVMLTESIRASVKTVDDRTRILLKLAAILVIFLGVYFSVGQDYVRQVMLYFLVLAGLYFSFWKPYLVIGVNALGLVLLFATTSTHWGVTTGGLVLLLGGTMPLPFYYYRRRTQLRLHFSRIIKGMIEKANRLQERLDSVEAERHRLENEIDKINQLYVLGRDLVEHMELGEVLDHLERILVKRSGVCSVSIFAWKKNVWHALSVSDPSHKDAWLEFLGSHKVLHWEKRFRTLAAPEFIKDQEMVFWPVRLEKDLIAAIILTTAAGFSERCIEEGEVFVPLISLCLKRTSLFEEVQERSRNDGLTGLYLRRYFLERLTTEIQRAKRYPTAFSLLMIDIDHFKSINDTYGHLSGDAVLCSLARIMVDCVRPGDLVGRYGGEEFIVLLPIAASGDAVKVAGEISRMVTRKEFQFGEARCRLSVSIGISHYPHDGATADALLSAADQALYWVKTHGRNGVKEYRDIDADAKNG